METQITVIEEGASSEISRSGFVLDLEGISKWLTMNGVISDSDTLNSYHDDFAWRRGGAETYISKFTLSIVNCCGMIEKKEIILKAIVSPPVERNLQNWSRRRKILSDNLIPVSNWYWFGEGLIVEDFYPYTYERVGDIKALLEIAKKLDILGFSTLSYLNDIRCDLNGEPFYVDFGFDLGDRTNVNDHNALNQFVKRFN